MRWRGWRLARGRGRAALTAGAILCAATGAAATDKNFDQQLWLPLMDMIR